MRTAVCDDDRKFCHRMKGILEQYEEKREIYMGVELFYDGNELCESMARGERYDLIFLDVLMSGVNGIETGKYIRKAIEDEEAKIIYVSFDEGHAVELFQNQPTNFLKKPVKTEQVFHTLDELSRAAERRRTHFVYKRGNLTYRIPYRDIFYYQSAGRKVQIHTRNRVWEYNGKLSHLLKDGLPSDFISIHKSYIVNRNYISEKRYDKIYIAAERIWLSISQAHRKEVRKRLKDQISKLGTGRKFSTNFDRITDEFCQKTRK